MSFAPRIILDELRQRIRPCTVRTSICYQVLVLIIPHLLADMFSEIHGARKSE
jgi:hypothetical protein